MGTLVRFDWAMKRLLRNKANFVILEGFLSELLKEPITIIEILESESNRQLEDDKHNRVDLLVKNSNSELIIIELQQNRQADYFHRMVYAASKLVTEQLSKGDEYSGIKSVISINILYFDLGQGDDYIYRGITQFHGLHKGDTLQLTDVQKKLYLKKDVQDIFPEYYILKVNNFNDVAKDTLDEWIYFFKNSDIKDSFSAHGIQKAKEELDITNLTSEERREYETFIDNRRIQNSEIKTALVEGRIIGKIEGIEEGIEKGRKNRDSEIVLNAFANNLPADILCKVSGLSTNKIVSILKKNKISSEKINSYIEISQ